MSLIALCDMAEVSEDEPRLVELGGIGYAVLKRGAEYFVLADQCTHGPGLLHEGMVVGDEIECPFHGGRFDLRTGAPTAPPCFEQVRVWTVHVEGENICIDPDEVR